MDPNTRSSDQFRYLDPSFRPVRFQQVPVSYLIQPGRLPLEDQDKHLDPSDKLFRDIRYILKSKAIPKLDERSKFTIKVVPDLRDIRLHYTTLPSCESDDEREIVYGITREVEKQYKLLLKWESYITKANKPVNATEAKGSPWTIDLKELGYMPVQFDIPDSMRRTDNIYYRIQTLNKFVVSDAESRIKKSLEKTRKKESPVLVSELGEKDMAAIRNFLNVRMRTLLIIGEKLSKDLKGWTSKRTSHSNLRSTSPRTSNRGTNDSGPKSWKDYLPKVGSLFNFGGIVFDAINAERVAEQGRQAVPQPQMAK